MMDVEVANICKTYYATTTHDKHNNINKEVCAEDNKQKTMHIVGSIIIMQRFFEVCHMSMKGLMCLGNVFKLC